MASNASEPSDPGPSAPGGPGTAPGARADRTWPRIGLPTYVEVARWGVWDRAAALLPHSYVASVVAAGGVPVLLPPVVPPPVPDAGADAGADAGVAGSASGPGAPERPHGPEAVVAAARRAVEGLDGLLLTGGADVEPVRYGDEPAATTQAPRPDRDAWELALLDAALGLGLPVLAICRGAQVLNVACGGTLHQHVPDLVGHTGHQPGNAVLGTTPVRLAPGSLAASILGTEVKVPCYHHQSIDRLGDGITAVGWADDGIVEAVELAERPFVLGVQWHPEDGDDPRLFDALVATAAEGR